MIEHTLSDGIELDWTNKTYTYGADTQKHAVTSVVVTDENNVQTTNTYRYDANGNMTCRAENGAIYLQTYNAENHLNGIALLPTPGEGQTYNCSTVVPQAKTWAFTYDGDGIKVKQVFTDSTSTLTTYFYVGGSYELETDGTTSTVTQYYAIAGMTVAMRTGETWSFFLTDHLGSVVGVTDASGALISETRYLPFGEVRTDVGTITQTDFGFTFQRNLPEMGLMDYKARFYNSSLGRFVQPDTIVPGSGNPQAYNRYSYVFNMSINAIDPSGNKPCDEENGCLQKKEKEVTLSMMKDLLQQNFGWTLGESITLNQSYIIHAAGLQIQSYVNVITHGNGQNWMPKNLQGIYFSSDNPFASMGIDQKHILLAMSFDTSYWGPNRTPNSMIIHEIGHVLDNKIGSEYKFQIGIQGIALAIPPVISGNGPADWMIKFLGGHGSFPRYQGGVSFSDSTNLWKGHGDDLLYGNNSSADYFANTLEFSVVSPSLVPPSARLWMNSFIFNIQ